MRFTSGNGWKRSLISLPSTLLPVNLPMASDDIMRPVNMKKAARTNTKYMMRLDNLIWFSPFFLFFFFSVLGTG